jgi:hypothetical protein
MEGSFRSPCQEEQKDIQAALIKIRGIIDKNKSATQEKI